MTPQPTFPEVHHERLVFKAYSVGFGTLPYVFVQPRFHATTYPVVYLPAEPSASGGGR